MTRVLLSAALALGVAACSSTGGTSAVTPAQVVTTAQTVASALTTALPAIAALPAVAKDPKAVAAIQTAEDGVAKANAALTALAANLPTAQQGAVSLSLAFSYLNAATAAAMAIPGLPPQVQTYVDSAAIGLPVLELFVNTTLGTQLKAVAKPAS